MPSVEVERDDEEQDLDHVWVSPVHNLQAVHSKNISRGPRQRLYGLKNV